MNTGRIIFGFLMAGALTMPACTSPEREKAMDEARDTGRRCANSGVYSFAECSNMCVAIYSFGTWNDDTPECQRAAASAFLADRYKR